MTKFDKLRLKFVRKLDYVKYLKELGFQIGENAAISPDFSIIDRTDPHLIKIGNNVTIATGVTILTHDQSSLIFCYKNGKLFGGGLPVSIGNNVFIGMHSIVLKGTNIGDNVIIGAGSVVRGNIESNSVYAGVPAKRISSIDDFELKVSERQIEEAMQIMKTYYDEYHDIPLERVFYSYNYAWLWAEIDNNTFFMKKRYYKNNQLLWQTMKNYKRPFKNYDDFVRSFLKKYNIDMED